MLVRTYILQIPYMSSNELPIHRSTFETGVSYHLRFATMKFCILLSLVMVSAAFARIPEGYELAPEDIPEYVEPTQHQLRSRMLAMSYNPSNNPHILEGPWPECQGESGTNCRNYIQRNIMKIERQMRLANNNTLTHGDQTVKRMTRVSVINTNVYQPHRVWIYCDAQRNVVQPPEIG